MVISEMLYIGPTCTYKHTNDTYYEIGPKIKIYYGCYNVVSGFSEIPDNTLLSPGIEALRSGGVIALPTDTIYGVASLAQNQQAVNKIYHMKRRVESKPLAICVGEIDQVNL